MSFFQTNAGSGETAELRLPDTVANTLVTAGNSAVWVESVRVVNTSGTAADITIDRFIGGVAYVLVQEHSIAVKSTESADVSTSVYKITEPFSLEAGETLRVTTTAGGGPNTVHCHATFFRRPN